MSFFSLQSQKSLLFPELKETRSRSTTDENALRFNTDQTDEEMSLEIQIKKAALKNCYKKKGKLKVRYIVI